MFHTQNLPKAFRGIGKIWETAKRASMIKYILNKNAYTQYRCENFTVPLMLFCNLGKVVSQGKTLLQFSQVETCLQNYHAKLSHTKPGNSFILKSNFFYSKFKLFHGLVSFQRRRRSFLHNLPTLKVVKKQKENYKDFCANKKWN